jgi:hypothetical protein
MLGNVGLVRLRRQTQCLLFQVWARVVTQTLFLLVWRITTARRLEILGNSTLCGAAPKRSSSSSDKARGQDRSNGVFYVHNNRCYCSELRFRAGF